MKRFAWIALCLLLVIGLSACGKKPPEPVVSTPMSDVSNDNTQSTTSSTTTATTGALVVTDAQGTAVTDADGNLVTTIVTALPTIVRPVTDPSGSTVTKVDGTVETEVVVPPHITVATDAEGTTHTSLVPEQTTSVETTTSTTTTSTTSSTESTATSTTKPTQQEIVDAVSLPAEGYTPDNRIKLGSVTLSDRMVTMEIRNISAAWESEEGKSYFEYTCFDKNNVKLKVDKINFGYIPAKSSKICTFEIPKNTVMVELTDFKVEYWSKPV